MWRDQISQVSQMELYYFVATFLIYSFLGWCIESAYMSFCNRKLTNRGFGKGPFCPIYGFGAMIGYSLLVPFRGNLILLYIVSAISATLFELFVGKMMIRALGELWWDYHDKPFNYKGILCLESSIAWGFYGIGIVCFLNQRVVSFVHAINYSIGSRIVIGVLALLFVDYTIQLSRVFEVDTKKYKDKIIEKVEDIRSRWE